MRRCAAYTTSRGARAFTASISRDHRAIKRAPGPAYAPVASVLIRRVKPSAATANLNDDAYADADATTTTRDHRAMKRALELARDAGARGEIPIGAVLIDDETGETVAEASNACEATNDPTAHAEMRLIRAGAEAMRGNWRSLKRTTMVVTLEPCAMCAGAILQSRVGSVVYGAKNTLLGADGSWVSMLRKESVGEDGAPCRPHAFTPDITVRGGVMAEETGALMKEFFKRRRTLGTWSVDRDPRDEAK